MPMSLQKPKDGCSRRQFLFRGAGVVSTLLAGVSFRGGSASALSSFVHPAWLKEAQSIVDGIKPPTFPWREHRLVPQEGDSKTVVQSAIDECNRWGGGKVILTAGTWFFKGPLRLTSNVHLHLEKGANVRFSGNSKDYLPTVPTRWEGSELLGYSPFIYAYHATNVAITGEGTLSVDPAGDVASWRILQNEAQKKLRALGSVAAPLAEREFGEGDFLRQSFIQFFGCCNVLVEGVRIGEMPFWGVHLVYSHFVTIRGISVDSMQVNNDGVDVDSSTDVLIEGCTFNTGDDCVAVKSGRDLDGRRIGAPSERIVVRDCVMTKGGSAGIAIGSEMSGGVRKVYVLRCSMGEVDTVVNVKSNLDRGGVVEHLRVWNVRAERSEKVIQITTSYHGYIGGNNPPVFRDIEIDDVRCSVATTGIAIRGVAQSPIERVVLRNVEVPTCKTPSAIQEAKNLFFSNVKINGAPVNGI